MSVKDNLEKFSEQQAVELIKEFDKSMEEVVHVWNESRQGYDIINLKTGAISKNTKLPTLGQSDFSWERADLICNLIKSGHSITSICKREGMPSQMVLSVWRKVHPHFGTRMEEARLERAEYYHDMALDTAFSISDKEEVAIAKLQIDTLKWAAEKGNPHRYANNKPTEQGTKGGITVIIETGVPQALTVATTAIEVDEYGEFKGTGVQRKRIETASIRPDGEIPYIESRVSSVDEGELGNEVSGEDRPEQDEDVSRGSDLYTIEPLDTSGAVISGADSGRGQKFGSSDICGYTKKKTK